MMIPTFAISDYESHNSGHIYVTGANLDLYHTVTPVYVQSTDSRAAIGDKLDYNLHIQLLLLVVLGLLKHLHT
jgi:hypothetical protein